MYNRCVAVDVRRRLSNEWLWEKKHSLKKKRKDSWLRTTKSRFKDEKEFCQMLCMQCMYGTGSGRKPWKYERGDNCRRSVINRIGWPEMLLSNSDVTNRVHAKKVWWSIISRKPCGHLSRRDHLFMTNMLFWEKKWTSKKRKSPTIKCVSRRNNDETS